MLTRRKFTKLGFFSLGLGLASCTQHQSQTNLNLVQVSSDADLVIWWEQGFLPEENEQLIQLVRKWEQATQRTVDLKLLPVDLIDQQLNKIVADPNNRQVPDIVYSVGIDTSLAPKMAWRDQLLDLTDVLTPIKAQYNPVALSQVSYRNKVRGERAYYAMPLWQSDDYIHYWGNLIQEIGLDPQAIPQQWDAFWQFWQEAQAPLRAKGHSKLHSVGLCMSSIGFDTYTSLLMFLDAYNVGVVDEVGEFLLEMPENRQRFIAALSQYTSFYTQGFVPETAVQWTGGGNNTAFLDGRILMTQNLTLSIPLTQKLTNNSYNQDALKRYQQIVTIDRPQKTDGTPLLTRKGIKQAIVPKASPHHQAAKEFLSYLVQPENLTPLVQGFKGRVLPVMPQLLNNAFWRDSSDPHLSSALKIYDRPSLVPHEVMHSAFSEVQNQQLWAKTVLKVIQDKASPTEAVDWSIAQIKPIWQAWERPV